MALADLDRLKANLLTSGLQSKDSALYQVINQLIDATKQLQSNVITQIIRIGGGSITGTQTFLTANSEGTLSNSRQLIAGDRIEFDITVPGQLIINARAIKVFQQPTEPMDALPGDIWIS